MLKIVRGRSWSFDATIYDTYVAEGDPGNVPTNHTGWTIRSQIRKKVGNVLVANLNVTFPVPTAGTVAIRHDRVFTRSLPIGSYWWDIVATDPSGIDHVYIEPEPIEVHDHPTDPANSTYDFVPGGGGAVYHTHSISDITGLQALLDDRLPPDGGTIARYLRGDNTWQLLNKSAVGLSLVENVTLSTWAGSANITQLGTVISGSWQGSRIAPAYLGDGTGIETKFLRGDGTWQTVSGGGGATAYIDLTDAASVNLPAINTPLASALAGKAATSHTHTASQISDSTTTGRALLTAATQSDARTTGLGSGATGDELFQALTPAAARTTLELGAFSPSGSITGTGELTLAAGGSNQNVTITPSGTGKIVASKKIDLNSITYTGTDAVVLVGSGMVESLPSGLCFFNNANSPFFNLAGSASTSTIFGGGISGSSFRAIRILAGGQIVLGSGSAAPDVGITRSGIGVLEINNGTAGGGGALKINATTASISTTTGALVVSGGVGIAGAVNSLYQRVGSGSPEGVVTAPVGAVFHSTNGGAGTSFYVKESGTGNTGWVAK